MHNLLPSPRQIERIDDGGTALVTLLLETSDADVPRAVIEHKFEDVPGLHVAFSPDQGPGPATVVTLTHDPSFGVDGFAPFERDEAYELVVGAGESAGVSIRYAARPGLLNALSTLKQLLSRRGDAFVVPHVKILDYPNTEVRSVSTTFAWYAGFSRAGFDSQLWDFEGWKSFLDTCSDFKINQVNLCMYGYWPFTFDEFPETTLANYPMKVWNKESRAWVEIAYTHPNIVHEFLPDLIRYAHERCIKIFAYVGLNSYNGGYGNIHKDRRAKRPSDKYINDFDFLCLSDPRNIDYLGKCMTRLAQIGPDGIIFEEAEENYWYCSCERCRERYGAVSISPADAKHRANRKLMNATLYPAIRAANPDCEIGVRMLREEPVEKPVSYLEEARDGLPPDIYLYWAPGPYCPESEFEKWVSVFGADHICARDTEGSGFSASMGRLFYMFRSNILRPDVEHLHWSVEADIDQYIGAVRRGCRGINGYLFEYTAFFMYLFAPAQYGWNAAMPAGEFPRYALQAVFGDVLGETILQVMQRAKIVHESQLPVFTLFFPFLRHKVGPEDVDLLTRTRLENEELLRLLSPARATVDADPDLRHYRLHLEKLENMLRRHGVIFEMALASIRWAQAEDPAERLRLLREVEALNEQDLGIVKDIYFDVNPHDRTGVKVCGFPYHEIKRTIDNLLDPEHPDETTIYLGTETLGFLWI